ncbi:MAG: hypothetical protein F9K35_16005, partial [Burkholderiaceae bacterium]
MRPHHPCRLALLAALVCTTPAHAAIVGTGTPGSCTEGALNTALQGGGTVTFDCGAAAHTITLTGAKTLTADTAIDGGGLITLDGGGVVQLFRLSGAANNYMLRGLVLSHGKATNDSGGAVYVDGATLLLNDVTLLNNTAVTSVAWGGVGGAVYARGGAQVTLSRVTASGNSAASGGVVLADGAGTTLLLSEFVAESNHAVNVGGAVTHRGSALSIQRSLFMANSVLDSEGPGGAVQVAPPTGTTSLTIANSTFQGNTSSHGSALSAAQLSPGSTIANSTFANNTGASTIIAWTGAALTLKNTIVSNSVNGPNCVTDGGTITNGGNNLQFGGITPLDSCGATIPQANPRLSPLAHNGGFSQTMALQAGSPAIDTGNGCAASDQRGVARPIGPACDIGAFEAPLALPPGGGVASVPALGGTGLAVL